MNITNEDNMKLMARYEDNHFDLAIVDPPYGIGESGGKIGVNKYRKNQIARKNPKHKKKKWDKKIPTSKYFKELKRVSKNQIVWGANYMTKHLKPSMGWIFWDKKNEGTPFSDGEFAYTSFNKGAKVYRLSSKQGTRGGRDRIHPTQKPVKLYEWLLMNYAKEGDKILDTHLGSGSIAIACHNLKYDLTACELDTEYYDAAMLRLKQHQKQIRLF